MSSELNQLRLEQVQSTLSGYAELVKRQPPSRGWLKLIREALGRTERQQAQRLGISGATLHKSEQSEAENRISLGQLRKLADGLDRELVYALVPRRPLTDVVQERARAIAMEEVASVAHTMGLEDQRPGADPPDASATKVWASEPHPKDPNSHVVKILFWQHDRGDVYLPRT